MRPPKQLSLLTDTTASYHGGNEFSVAANDHASAGKAEDRLRIAAFLRERAFGMTCDEIEVGLGMRHQTVSARLVDLKRAGVVIVSGRRATRTGAMAGVNYWKGVEHDG